MGSSSPVRPIVKPGALVVYESQEPDTEPTVIPFQYNPEQVRRTLAHRSPQREPSSKGNAAEDLLRVAGPPVETINLTVSLQAADQPPGSNEASQQGQETLHPVLATLELLLYPPSLRIKEIKEEAEAGRVELASYALPLTLLVWGESRIVPVHLTSFTITEEAFDTNLNPIRAKVELGMRVLTYIEFTKDKLGRSVFVAYQDQKEGFANQFHPGEEGKNITQMLPSKTGSR